MSVLRQKLQQASKLFHTHCFKKSLQAYAEAAEFSRQTRQEPSLVHNILSAKASLEYILGDLDGALATLNCVLSKDPWHFLSLLRRSQVLKKKGQLRRAHRDLQAIFVFCPDNLQISAFKGEIEHTLLKQGSTLEQSSSDEEQDPDDQDEAVALNFMNLKMIDRHSSDLSAPRPHPQRKSRVTILGDSTFEYASEPESKGQVQAREGDQAKEGGREEVSDKAIRTCKQIEGDSEGEEGDSIEIKVLPPKRTKKSILKNKGTSIFIAEGETDFSRKERYLCRQSKLLEMLRDIDGKVISASHNDHTQLREVEFRKSVSQVAPLEEVLGLESPPLQSLKPSAQGSGSRKSCLKRPSFDLAQVAMKAKRSSKFELLSLEKIDGKLLQPRRRQSIEQGQGGGVQQPSDSDEDGSSHNIFGSSDLVMTEELKLKLFARAEPGTDSPCQLKKKQSILKKSSLLMGDRKSSMRQKEDGTELFKEQSHFKEESLRLKSKKSVMFSSTM